MVYKMHNTQQKEEAEKAAFKLNTLSPYVKISGLSINFTGFFLGALTTAYFLVVKPTLPMLKFAGVLGYVATIYFLISPTVNSIINGIWTSIISNSISETRIKKEKTKNENNFFN